MLPAAALFRTSDIISRIPIRIIPLGSLPRFLILLVGWAVHWLFQRIALAMLFSIRLIARSQCLSTSRCWKVQDTLMIITRLPLLFFTANTMEVEWAQCPWFFSSVPYVIYTRTGYLVQWSRDQAFPFSSTSQVFRNSLDFDSYLECLGSLLERLRG